VKRFFVPLIAIVAAAAAADTGDDVVTSALTSLRSSSWFHVTLNGTQTLGSTSNTFKTDLWWQCIGTGTRNAYCQVECTEWWNDKQTAQTVGDGTSMWAYDAVRNRYTVATYGAYGTVSLPANYVYAAVEAFKATSKGATEYLAKLLCDTFAASTVRLTPWMKPRVAGETLQTDVETGYVAYEIGTPPYRWVQFNVSQNASGNYVLGSIGLQDQTTIGSETQTTTWTATIDTSTTPPSGIFNFTVPAGAKEITGSKPG
jgi:outer membrane lipoprotein-sorting protein